MIIYSIPNNDKKIRVQFHRKLFSVTIRSHNGKYKSETLGILKEYQKPIGSCIFFNNGMIEKVTRICNKFKIEYKLYKIKEIKY